MLASCGSNKLHVQLGAVMLLYTDFSYV